MVCHEKHKNQGAGLNPQAPIGARNTSIAVESLFVFFVANLFGGFL
jgi:hypothetical protein